MSSQPSASIAPGRPPEAYALITPPPLIRTRPISPGAAGAGIPPGASIRTSEPAGRPAEPGLRASSGFAVIMLAASVIP